ncbi:MAG: ComEC family competence protein [Geminicoccaceae bacterium]|nr:ComEC family competence protein [Geminicoccaceae bacterium]MDW8368733.1 ComEC/Rec2 family competence protein [Geminicoccaceae bacterium]
MAEADRWFLWLPVAVAVGIVGFLSLGGPPPRAVWIAGGLLVPLLAALAAGQARVRPLVGLVLAALAAIAVGVAAIGLRLETVAAPVLERAGAYTVEGRIVEIAPRTEGGVRLLLDQLSIDRLDPETIPERIRVTLRSGGDGLEVGMRLRLRAMLQPPRGPVVPGGFDFARQAWFERLGAVGWALARPQLLEPAEPGSELAAAALRVAVTQRLVEVLPGTDGAIAAALLTGLRGGIDDAIWRDFQRSGLAHLLAISGLHMTLVAGTVFLLARWGLALVPALALRVAVKKPAALLALLAAAFYLALSGGTIPTQRAFLMVAAALLAILAGRDPLSLRLLACAATLVLLVRPEAVLGASFQLSFAAVLALIAVWERIGRGARTSELGLLGRLARYLLGVAATTLVASLATTPLAAFHFQTVPTYGVLANLLAVPLTTFWIMPAGLLGLMAMPLGLDGPPIRLMGAGIDLLLAIAHTAARLPGAALAVPAWPEAVLPLLWGGGLWLALWRRPWRLLGLVPIVLALVLVARHRPPDLVVTPWLAQIATTGSAGASILAFEEDEPTEAALARALGGPGAEDGGRDRLRCDRAGCRLPHDDRPIVLARRLDALLQACREPGLVIARVGPERCPSGPAELVGPRALALSGGLAVWIGPNGTLVRRTVTGERGAWPWARPAGRAENSRDR